MASQKNLQKMKEVIKSMIEKYGMYKVHMSVITYGSEAVTNLNFTKKFSSEKKLHEFIHSIRQPSGDPLLDKALRDVRTVFQHGTRPESVKVF